MSIQATPDLGNTALEALILRAVVRRLVTKGVFTSDDVQSLLVEAAEQLTTDVGNDLTVEAAKSIVKGDLASFLSVH